MSSFLGCLTSAVSRTGPRNLAVPESPIFTETPRLLTVSEAPDITVLGVECLPYSHSRELNTNEHRCPTSKLWSPSQGLRQTEIPCLAIWIVNHEFIPWMSDVCGVPDSNLSVPESPIGVQTISISVLRPYSCGGSTVRPSISVSRGALDRNTTSLDSLGSSPHHGLGS